jgi:hypothetical protein
MIRELPSRELAQKYSTELVDGWITAGLAGAYPDFVELVRSMSQEYSFLASGSEESLQ